MKLKRSTTIPLILLAYLGALSYIGRDELKQGNYLYYFGIIGCTLMVIAALHFSLKRKERLRKEREDDLNSNGNQPR